MKFSKLLSSSSAALELEAHTLRYKLLKKKIKAFSTGGSVASGPSSPSKDDSIARAEPQQEGAHGQAGQQQPQQQQHQQQRARQRTSDEQQAEQVSGSTALSPEENEFITILNEDLNMFNTHFMEKEEDAVIRLHELTEQLHGARNEEELQPIKASLVDFHGEMVLLLHWSLLNYAAVVKILKKHDKRTGLLLRAPYLANVLQQPFSSTSIMSRLVKRAEELVSLSLDGMQQQRLQHQLEQRQQQQELEAAQRVAEQALGAERQGGRAAWDRGARAANAGVLGGSGIGGGSSSVTCDGASDDDCTSLVHVQEGMPDAQLFKRTMLALETWATLRRTAHTPSTVLEPQAFNNLSKMARAISADAAVNASTASAAASVVAGGPPGVLGKRQSIEAESLRTASAPQLDAMRAVVAGLGAGSDADGGSVPSSAAASAAAPTAAMDLGDETVHSAKRFRSSMEGHASCS